MRGNGKKKMKKLAKDHRSISHRHSQQCGDRQRERGVAARIKVGGGQLGTSVIVSTIFKKSKNKK